MSRFGLQLVKRSGIDAKLLYFAPLLGVWLGLIGPSSCCGGIIRLDNTSGGLGELLDGITAAQLGTPSAGPLTVPGLDPDGAGSLSVIVTGLNGGGELNSTAQSLGINSIGSDSTSRFDAAFGEFVKLRFNRDVRIGQLDFTSFSAGEAFRFAGREIAYDDLANKSTDLFLFRSPLEIPAHTPFELQATVGQIGIEAWDLTFTPVPVSVPASATVPEPSSVALMMGLCAGLVRRGRRGRRSECLARLDAAGRQGTPVSK